MLQMGGLTAGTGLPRAHWLPPSLLPLPHHVPALVTCQLMPLLSFALSFEKGRGAWERKEAC